MWGPLRPGGFKSNGCGAESSLKLALERSLILTIGMHAHFCVLVAQAGNPVLTGREEGHYRHIDF